MSVFVVKPQGIDVRHWANQMVLSLSAYGCIPKLMNRDDWRSWAALVVSLPAIAAVNAPRPDHFVQWETWAEQFNLSIRLLE